MAPRAVIGRVEEDKTSGRTARACWVAGLGWSWRLDVVYGHTGTRFTRRSPANRLSRVGGVGWLYRGGLWLFSRVVAGLVVNRTFCRIPPITAIGAHFLRQTTPW